MSDFLTIPAEEIKKSNLVAFNSTISSKMIFPAGKGRIEIDCYTGKVELINCELDEASLAFWKGLSAYYPR